MKENIVLTDFEKDRNEEFIKSLENMTNMKWKVKNSINNGLRNTILDNIKRYIKYFTFPFKMFLNRKKIDRIIAWQQFYGLIYAFYCRLFRVKKENKLYIMTFIYKPKKSILGKLYFKFIKYIVKSDYIDKIICFSQKECIYYSNLFQIEQEKITSVKLGIEKLPELNLEPSEEKYILLAGRSNRDYNFIIESLKNTKYKVKIICDEFKNVEKFDNIEIYNNVFNLEYYKMLAKAFCVVIPLADEKISSGQLVVLQSMQYKKPVIITYNEPIQEYIVNNENGIMIQKDKEELLQSLKIIYKDKELYNRLATNGFEKYKESFSIEALGNSVGKIINKENI